MAMRLLKKSEIATAKAADTKQSIDEGLKLARRVDNLREVAAVEETALYKWRDETIATIHEQITQKATERDTLEAGNVLLRAERAELQKPLDDAWASYHTAHASLVANREAVIAAENAVATREKAVSTAEDALFKEALAVNAAGVATQYLKEQVTGALEEAKLVLADAEKVKQAVMANKAVVEESLMHREQAVGGREVNATMKEKFNAEQETEIAAGWKLLKDREAMFERNLKRKQYVTSV